MLFYIFFLLKKETCPFLYPKEKDEKKRATFLAVA